MSLASADGFAADVVSTRPWTQLDPRFTAVLLASLLAHSLAATYVMRQPRIEVIEPPAERISVSRSPLLKNPFAKQPVSRALPESDLPRLASKPGRRQAAKVPVPAGLLGVIGSLSAEGGAFDGVLAGTSAASVAEALRDASVLPVDVSGAGSRWAGGVGAVARIELLATAGARQVELPEPVTPVSPGRLVALPTAEAADELLAEEVTRFVRLRRAALQSCYERALKHNPRLRGRLSLRFTVTPRGRVAGASADDEGLNSSEVSSCVTTLMRAWVLPIKPETDMPVSFPLVFAPAG